MTKKKTPPETQSLAVLGGIARAAKLSPERIREIARSGGLAKASAKAIADGRDPALAQQGAPKATHRGNFKVEFGFDVECYVLDDEQKTAVISQRGMGVAIGLSRGGGRVQRLLQSDRVSQFVGPDLEQKLANPVNFLWVAGGPNPPPAMQIDGYDVTILIDVCKVILAADAAGRLQTRHNKLVKQASVILHASAKAGIKNLVYALAGYDATRAEVIKAFKIYVEDEAREYEKEFPEELYEEWYRLYDLPKPERGRTWKFKNLTIDHVYRPLAQSNGKILELTRAQKAKSDHRRAKLHQFLSDIGVKALRTHLGRLLGMAEASETVEEYERLVKQKFGVKRKMIQGSLDL